MEPLAKEVFDELDIADAPSQVVIRSAIPGLRFSP